MNPVIIVFLVFAAALIFIKMLLDYNRAKLETKNRAGEDRSLGSSELRTLIQESVSEEIRPIVEKLERLEREAGLEDARMELDEGVEGGKEADRTSRPTRQR